MHSNSLVPLILFGSLVWLFWLRTNICTYFMIHYFSFAIQQPNLFNVQPSIFNIQKTEGPGRACSGSWEERG